MRRLYYLIKVVCTGWIGNLLNSYTGPVAYVRLNDHFMLKLQFARHNIVVSVGYWVLKLDKRTVTK